MSRCSIEPSPQVGAVASSDSFLEVLQQNVGSISEPSVHLPLEGAAGQRADAEAETASKQLASIVEWFGKRGGRTLLEASAFAGASSSWTKVVRLGDW